MIPPLSPTKLHSMTLKESQFFHFYARVMKTHAEIVSGAYKLESVHLGSVVDSENRPMTDEEKLLRKIDIMNNYINQMSECAEGFAQD